MHRRNLNNGNITQVRLKILGDMMILIFKQFLELVVLLEVKVAGHSPFKKIIRRVVFGIINCLG